MIIPIAPETSIGEPDNKETQNTKNETSTSNTTESEDITEVEVEEETSARGEAKLDSNASVHKKKGKASKEKTLDVTDDDTPKGSLGGKKGSSLTNLTGNNLLAKTGGENINFALLLTSLSVLITALIGIFILRKKEF